MGHIDGYAAAQTSAHAAQQQQHTHMPQRRASKAAAI
jgi:hypothetical protein